MKLKLVATYNGYQIFDTGRYLLIIKGWDFVQEPFESIHQAELRIDELNG